MPSALIFVDLPSRDFMGDALIAHELRKLGITCHLEPLQSWQSAVFAYKPNLVLFNHLTTEKLADYSQTLKGYNILVGSLLNEGLTYEASAREFVSRKQFPQLHCDLHLCWNDHHRDALIDHRFCSPPEMARTVGCPRFDFYQQPWAQIYQKEIHREDNRPVILVNTTFALAHFKTLPRENADRFFADWKDKIAGLNDYMAVVDSHYDGRNMLPPFLEQILDTGEYRIILRPHPREELGFYDQWFDTLPPDQRSLISLSVNEPPFRPILASDLVLNCEDCTTSMEAWLARKPTLTIALAQHPYFYTETYKRLSPIVDQPSMIVEEIRNALQAPEQSHYQPLREAHLKEWLYSSDGRSARRAAEEIAALIRKRNNTPKIPFSFRGWRQKLKLLTLHAFDEPYTFQPKHFLRRRLDKSGGQHTIKYRNYLKSIRPSQVREGRLELEDLENGLAENVRNS